jgi:hypothetical protein
MQISKSHTSEAFHTSQTQICVDLDLGQQGTRQRRKYHKSKWKVQYHVQLKKVEKLGELIKNGLKFFSFSNGLWWAAEFTDIQNWIRAASEIATTRLYQTK